MAEIETKKVVELLEHNFFIPSYQRGYRWTEQQIIDLLLDIDTFKTETDPLSKEELWYCLQPLVVKKMNENDVMLNLLDSSKEWYEVVDGQQRLTTILLLVHYFNEYWNGKDSDNEFEIRYQTRPETAFFLKNLEVNTQEIVSSGDLKCDDTIDFQHIADAYKQIALWGKGKKESKVGFNRRDFQSKFLCKTRVIWYEIEEYQNPIDTFIRINMGKIPLTNAELIKALFLTKKNFTTETAELLQIEIATEWDRIEYALHDNDFWWFLNKEENALSARIEYIFNIMYDIEVQDNKNMSNLVGTDEHKTFRFFYNKFSQSDTDVVKEKWDEVKDYYLAFKDWYNEPTWYHYIGYLIYCDVSITSIYQKYRNTNKNEFLQELKKLVKETIGDIDCIKTAGKYKISLSYEDNKSDAKVRKFLLLFNIVYILKNETGQRFPFKAFKKEDWDIEHVDSFTEKEIYQKEDQDQWLRNALLDVDIQQDSIKLKIEEILENKKFDRDLFLSIKTQIISIAREDGNSEEEKNRIGNLTLLDAGTNRSYGNALFLTKRRKIIERDKGGLFIPVCTKNVFLKYFDLNGSTKNSWRAEDIDEHEHYMGIILDEFLTIREGAI